MKTKRLVAIRERKYNGTSLILPRQSTGLVTYIFFCSSSSAIDFFLLETAGGVVYTSDTTFEWTEQADLEVKRFRGQRKDKAYFLLFCYRYD